MANKLALVIENEMKDFKKIETLLKARDIDCDLGTSALEAIIKLKEKSYAFLVLDLDLGTGIDEGKFLLDKMQQEGLFVPTIILSVAGFMPGVMALRGKYSFLHETIDKGYLHDMLPVLDMAISRLDETSEKEEHERAGEPSLVSAVETNQKRVSWSPEAKIALIGIFIALATLVVTLTVPEVRRYLRLESSNDNPQPTNEKP